MQNSEKHFTYIYPHIIKDLIKDTDEWPDGKRCKGHTRDCHKSASRKLTELREAFGRSKCYGLCLDFPPSKPQADIGRAFSEAARSSVCEAGMDSWSMLG